MTSSKSTKRALVSSALAVLMCVAMLIGTTFAWFTDEASTSVNRIEAGTLKVDIEKPANYDGWTSAEGKTLLFKQNNASGSLTGAESVLWEPGATYTTDEFRIRNNGNLALKYKMTITGFEGDMELLDAIDFNVKVWMCGKFDSDWPWAEGTGMKSSHHDHEAEECKLIATIPLSEMVDYESVILPGDPVINKSYDNATDETSYVQIGASYTFAIEGHMKESAGNEYQGMALNGLAIKVVATQATVEYDSYSNQYDKDAAYPVTAQQWAANFTNGATVTVDTPTAIDGKADTATGAINPDSEPVLNNAGEVELKLENTVTSGNLSGNTWGVMRVMPGTTLVISGDENGKFINTKSNSIINVNGGKVVVNSGYFESTSNIFFYYTDSDDAISNMSLTINGGIYKADGNVIRNPGMPATGITINGGTFYGWDPSSYVDENHTVTTSTEGSTTIYTVTEN